MKLCLVQHGHAVSKEEDPERPLSDSGRRSVERLGARLAGLGIGFSAILHSGKLRARQTAEIIAAHLPDEAPVSARDGLAPKDPVGPVAEELGAAREDILVAGHLPFLDRLASLLLTGDEDRGIVAFEPGAALCIEKDESGTWRIRWVLTPDLTL